MKDSFGNTLPEDAMIIRCTELTDFRNCQRDWFFRSHNGMNLTPVKTSAKLRFGSCWHRGQEKYFSGGDFLEGFHLGYDEEVESLVRQFGEMIYDSELQSQFKDELELGEAMWSAYPEWKDQYPKDKDMKVLAVEQRLLVPLTSVKSGKPTGVWVATKLDGVVDLDGVVFILEHKSTSKSSSVDNPDHLPLDLQMSVQLWVLREYLRWQANPAPLGGTIYNLARKQRPGPRVKAPIFGRHIVRRSNKELDIIHLDLLRDYMNMSTAKQEGLHGCTHNPRAWNSFCTWGCAFRSVCEGMMRGEDYEFLLSTGFVKREKDIWQMLEEEMGEGE